MQKENQTRDGVTVSLEIEGRYDDVMSKLATGEDRPSAAEPFLADVGTLLETVVVTGGGTRSVLAENLPPDMTVSYDAEEIVSLLSVLQAYDLVRLEGNTWKPGPALARGDDAGEDSPPRPGSGRE